MPSEKWREFMSKFAKKGALVVDVTPGKKPAMAVVGQENTAKGKKLLKDAGMQEAPAAKGKAAKAEKPAKGKAAKAAPKERAERVSADDTRKISGQVKENPHREGTGRYDAYEAVKKSKKVSDYLAGGHKAKYLAKWEADGHIVLG